MAETKIEWANKVWNPTTGCTKISSGCERCYAERMSKRLAGRFGYPENDPFCPTVHPSCLGQPLDWKKPCRVFVSSMGDLFHEAIPDFVVNNVFFTMSLCKQHRFLLLTKRPERMRTYISNAHGYLVSRDIDTDEFFGNIGIGVSIENQGMVGRRIPSLLGTPGILHFISCEPLLGEINLEHYLWKRNSYLGSVQHPNRRIRWVIVGCESGPGARPMKESWVRKIVKQCKENDVAVFYKQKMENGKKVSLPYLDGKQYIEYPTVLK